MSDKPIVDEIEISTSNLMGPRRTPSSRTTSSKQSKPAPPYRKGALVDPLTKFYGGLAIGLLPFAPRTASSILEQREWKDQESGETETISNAEAIARSWDEWAKTNPSVRRILYPLVNVSGGAKVFAAHFPIMVAAAMEFMPGLRFSDRVEDMLRRMSGATAEND